MYGWMLSDSVYACMCVCVCVACMRWTPGGQISTARAGPGSPRSRGAPTHAGTWSSSISAGLPADVFSHSQSKLKASQLGRLPSQLNIYIYGCRGMSPRHMCSFILQLWCLMTTWMPTHELPSPTTQLLLSHTYPHSLTHIHSQQPLTLLLPERTCTSCWASFARGSAKLSAV